MNSYYDWERALGTYLKQVQEFPQDEAKIAEELCEFVLGLCQEEYTKGYRTAMKKSMKVVQNETITDKIAHIGKDTLHNMTTPQSGYKPWRPGDDGDGGGNVA